MRICNSCGGIVGRDCFNPIECQWITDQMNYNNEREAQQVPELHYKLQLAEQTILSLQLANDHLQQEVEELKSKKD